MYNVIDENLKYTYDEITNAFTDVETYTCSGDSTSLYAYIRKRAQVVIDQYGLTTTCDFSKGTVGSTFESSSKILIPSIVSILIVVYSLITILHN